MDSNAGISSPDSKGRTPIQASSSRIAFLKSVTPADDEELLNQLSNGSLPSPSDDSADEDKFNRLKLANDLANISDEHPALTKALLADPEVKSLRDVALNYGDDKLEQLLPPGTAAKPAALSSTKISSPSSSTSASSSPVEAVEKFQRAMFNAETSAFIQRMLKNGELNLPKAPIASTAKLASQNAAITSSAPQSDVIQARMAQVLKNKPDFHFRNDGVSSLLSDPAAFSDIPDEDHPAVVDGLKDIALAQALTSEPKALPALVQAKLSAHKVSQLPEDQFIQSFSDLVGGSEVAKDIHGHAVQVTARNDHALTSIIQNVRGTGLAAIDGNETGSARITRIQNEVSNKPEQINLEKLFGSLDYCECSDCTSVTSPASYLVELLQFLRNNNLYPDTPDSQWKRWSDSQDIYGSPLDNLFRRRPDIACLELTCANTNTVLPYIDLANEVMESFIYHQQRYINSPRNRKQTWIDVFNSSDNADGLGGNSEDLMATPQNVNMHAYLTLQQSVYPAIKLPYNQPLDAIRQFLIFLGTKRSEVLRIFQARYIPPTKTTPDTWDAVICPCKRTKLPSPCPEDTVTDSCAEESDDGCSNDTVDTDEDQDSDPNCATSDSDDDTNTGSGTSSISISNEDQATLIEIHAGAVARSVAAEELGISQEEYIILTKQAFWRKQHFDIRHGEEVSVSTYRKRIGVKKDWEYWGLDYTSSTDMLDTTRGIGLTFVKSQFLPRTGILYADLVDVLRTNYINPNMPKGRSKVILESFRFSYQFLASKIDKSEKYRKARLRHLLQFLEHPTDKDSGFQEVVKGALKKQTCCQLLFANRQPPKQSDRLLTGNGEESAASENRKHEPKKCQCGCDTELRDWICKYFESVGKIIVLDSGEGQRLPWEGDIIAYIPPIPIIARVMPRLIAADATNPSPPALGPGEILVGHIHTDGSITVDSTSTVPVGYVALDGTVYSTNGVLLVSLWTRYLLKVVRTDQPTGLTSDGSITSQSKLMIDGVTTATPWTVTYDDCDLTKVRLQHLDGKSVTRHEYDRMHRFLRLWRKLDWTIAEVDAAISAFGAGPQLFGTSSDGSSTTDGSDDVDYDDLREPCECGKTSCDKCKGRKPHTKGGGEKPDNNESKSDGKYCGHCGKLKPVPGKKPTRKHCCCKRGKDGSETPTPDSQPTLDISPFLINQIAAVKKIIDLVGMSILQVLTLWTTIDQHGDKSLYAQLFLTHNILGIDRVFAPDADGHYLVQSPPAKISEHRPVILAAFNLKPDDLSDIIRIAAVNDDLTLKNISAVYRHSIFAKMLGLKPKYLGQFFKIFSTPWASAEKALEILNLWTKITDAGFEIQQLAYIFNNDDSDPMRPIGPTDLFVSQLAATIYTNLKDIESQHQNLASEDDATTALVTAKAQLIFSQSTVADIVGFLEGSRLYSTNAPTIANIKIPANLKDKLKYVIGTSPTLQTTGQLTLEEVGQAKAVSSNPKWTQAIDRLSKQAATFFKATLGPIFPNAQDAMSQLVSGDVVASTSPDNVPTAPKKRFYFLQYFIQFLQSQLSTQSIVSTMASATSLSNPIVTALLRDILVLQTTGTASGTSALKAIEAIKGDVSSQTSWNGYLVLSTTDKYTFYANSVSDDNQSAAISINGVEYAFSKQQDDPSNVWYGGQIQLTGGQMYTLQVRDQLATKLSWKTDLTVPSLIPSSSLIPAHATAAIRSVLVLLIKTAFYINNFNLSLDEVNYLHINGADFAGFNWNILNLDHLKRVNAYYLLRNGLPKSTNTLLQLFSWAKLPSSKAIDIPAQVNKATQWRVDVITNFISPTHFNLQNPTDFKDEVNLTKLKDAIAAASSINIDIDKLFTWARPAVSFTSLGTISDAIRTAIRTKYTLSDWDKAIKPTFDTLRQNQSQALVAYLVSQPSLIEQGIIDADSLFEFFLIDPSMCPCMQTSRLKQATSSVQLFIQRCLLGLEDQDKGFGTGVSLNLIDRQRWDWMQRYRLWEANRKVYLFPENWIQSSLRDDKSPEFQQLESQLLQKDITEQTTLDALKRYLFAVDEVANLQTVAIYAEDIPGGKGKDNAIPNIQTVHFFGRPAVAPYKYYHRTFDCVYATWTPWNLMQIDVPNYEIERSGNKNLNGCYVVPFSYNGRLIVGLPQFIKKQQPQPVPDQSFSDMAQGQQPTHPKVLAPLEYWEIKFGYTELLNGTWKQKVISNQAIWETPKEAAPEISEYQFVPEIQDPNNTVDQIVYINVLHKAAAVGRFAFNGSRVTRDTSAAVIASGATRVFHYTDNTSTHTVTSLQSLSSNDDELEYPSRPSVGYPVDTKLKSTVEFSSSIDEPFTHPFLHQLIATASRATTLDEFFGYFQTSTIDKKEAWGAHLWRSSSVGQYNELYRTYALYNWEMAFHAPMMLAEKLLETQQFDLALKMCHYVFDPYAKGDGLKRYWKMPAFQESILSTNSIDSLDKLFAALEPGKSVPIDDPINQWRKNPFEPHVLARLRPVAYMKWAVMKYIQILIAYGDWYFQQNTLEMIPMAIQMYVLASHLYGQRGQKIPRRGKKKPETYLTLLNSWDAFGNAMVQLELEFPFSNQIQKSNGNSNGVKGLANIFGFATNRYFCIPNNDQLTALRDTIDDRLYKIRHCEDIKGVFRILPLYEPPLDVRQLVAATAAGLSLRSVLNDLNTPMPNFKFTIMLAKAIELCNELKALGTAFLSAKEKGDAEALSVLRQQLDISIQNLAMESKKLALQEAQANLDALVFSRKRPEYQLTHALKLLGQDTGLVPGQDDEWKELTDDIAAPVQDSGLLISAEEKEEMDKSSQAKDVNTGTSVIQAIASDLKAFPIINGHASPFGVGVAACFGPGFIGDVMNGIAQVIRIGADALSFESTSAGRKNQHMRTNQDRTHTANNTGYELKSIDTQIAASNVRISMANQEITNQQKQIDNAQEVLDFFMTKYTNVQLYSFMEGRVRTLYYQIYQMAYNWARKAETCFQFERGVKDTNFIQPGYWEPGHDGLLSGEALFMSLKTMEAAYHENRGHDFEVSKFVSLRQINPLALIQFRETGACDFAIPEVLFDMDFPGHYLRKIKAVTLTIPCIIGPYTTVNCTVRLTAHKYRSNPIAKDAKDYVEKTPDQGDDAVNGDPRFDTVLIPISAAAVSSANNDAGVFDLSFSNSERFMPFEGAGAISQWSLALPSGFRQFDYSTIQDVVMQIRYTSRDGGDKLASAATGAVLNYIKTVSDLPNGLFSIVDARTEFATPWATFQRPPAPPPAPQQRVLGLNKLNERLPIYTKGHPASGIVGQNIWLVTDAQVAAGAWSLNLGNNNVSFTDGPAIGNLKVFSASGSLVISDWTLKLMDASSPVTKLWILTRYVMK
ncbi:hypothetical protein BKA64DRAFT_244791 [Cadophora sp. MPI-SDFR-AT-0126]|nr:hypothetical protein BKA64DRAFT_244791 [Leotiomycetes sp. MPI-SDFR-AT-0126]